MKKSNCNDKFLIELDKLFTGGILPEKHYRILLRFYECYKKVEEDKTAHTTVFSKFLSLVKKQLVSPFSFDNYHKMIQTPFDYYQFGLDFVQPLVDLAHSSLLGIENLEKICQQIKSKENVILLANHQTETDPQLISLLLQKQFPNLAKDMIFVAGDRVTTDPVAAPFSMGRNLLCIYSKRYIDQPIELKEKKQRHNQKTMQIMKDLLQTGGQAIYVAPSGGRDRKNDQGEMEVASFDPESIELFYLLAKKSKTPTHFYPLTLLTYKILPPPESIQIELGEERIAKYSPIHMSFGDELMMDGIVSFSQKKEQRRKDRACYICNLVRKEYENLQKLEDK